MKKKSNRVYKSISVVNVDKLFDELTSDLGDMHRHSGCLITYKELKGKLGTSIFQLNPKYKINSFEGLKRQIKGLFPEYILCTNKQLREYESLLNKVPTVAHINLYPLKKPQVYVFEGSKFIIKDATRPNQRPRMDKK